MRGQGGHIVFPIGPKNTNLVEDVEFWLLAYKKYMCTKFDCLSLKGSVCIVFTKFDYPSLNGSVCIVFTRFNNNVLWWPWPLTPDLENQ